jgi:hypothetical protein
VDIPWSRRVTGRICVVHNGVVAGGVLAGPGQGDVSAMASDDFPTSTLTDFGRGVVL